MRSRHIAAGLVALVLGAGVAACGGASVSVPAPATTPEITVSDEELVGLSGADDPAVDTSEDTSTDDTTDTTSTDESTTTDPSATGGTAVTPDTSSDTTVTPDTGAATATPPADTGGTATPPADTGGTATPPADDTTDDSAGDTGGAGFDDFCAQNPGAC